MGVPGNTNALLLSSTAAAQYKVERSLRFNSSDSVYLGVRTPSTTGNRRTFTWSSWVKRCSLGSQQMFMDHGNAATISTDFGFNSSDNIYFTNYNGGYQSQVRTTAVFRDPSAWYHVVIAVDTTQATEANRVKIYVNGTQQALTSVNGYPAQNFDTYANVTTYGATIGARSGGSFGSNAYYADLHWVDGQALDPTSFTEVSATTGQLIPKRYTGTFGTNGFWLQFADNSNNTATTLGKDTSPNGNNWTPTNFSVTAGAGNDSLVDTPTSYGTDDSLGGSVRGNYCTLNPLDNAGPVLANGNLDASRATASWSGAGCRATFGVSAGKWYWEVTQTSAISGSANNTLGISKSSANLNSFLGNDANGWGYDGFGGSKFNNTATGTAYGATWTTNDVIGIALDADAGSLTFYKNGVSQGQAFTGLTSGPYFPAISLYGTISCVANFGQRPWAFPSSVPSGFRPLVDTCLSAPVVAKPNTVFDAILWTGTGTSQTVTGLSFSPDLLWIKKRNNVDNHSIFDSVRGTGKYISSNLTNAEAIDNNSLTAFNSNGFSSGGSVIGDNNNVYITWAWDAGTSTVTNTQGSITSSVRANASAGFSIVTFTGNQTSGATVGHGLGVAPQMIFLKSRSATGAWYVYHESIGNTKYLLLNATDAAATSAAAWNNTSPSSTVFTLGNNIQTSGVTQVAYCFAPVAGYSSFGSYVGNGSASDGPFVYTGHRVRWLLVKNSNNTDGWSMWDAARDPYNEVIYKIEPNSSGAEGSNAVHKFDFLSNGFRVRGDWAGINGSGNTIIFACFAESPFQYARAR